MEWSNDQGGSGEATGTESWTITGIALTVGAANVITVTAYDTSGNSAADTITITRPDVAVAIDFAIIGGAAGSGTGTK